MTTPSPSGFLASIFVFALTVLLASAPSMALAALGDCSQPVTNGDNPTASDCLRILQVAVGLQQCTPQACVCDVNGSAQPPDPPQVTAADALQCLNRAVGGDVPLACPCESDGKRPGPKNTCTEGRFVATSGSDLDSGWNGAGHNAAIIEGASVVFEVVRRCSNDADTICVLDDECPGGECVPYCDCDDPTNSVCEVTGPNDERRCVADFEVCDTNADCASGQECQLFFGPPLPLSAEGTPACVTTFFEQLLSGEIDASTGTGEASAFLRSRVHLGISIDRPCPACGSLAQNPEVGDMFTCNGGAPGVNGRACRVDAFSPDFGGVSFDCPPNPQSNVSGRGLAINFSRITTGTVTEVGTLPCFGPLGNAHPSSGNGACLDDFSACSTNADCLRCTNDLSACSSNGDCSGGVCAAAPAQPITCGVYCHCGFCDNDPDAPCFSDADCGDGEVCMTGDNASGGQAQPNNCADLVCGRVNDDECCTSGQPGCTQPTGRVGECSLQPFRGCASNTDCQQFNAGTCTLMARPCFEPVISRTGTASPLGMHCVDDPDVEECTSNADCGVGNCVGDTSEPVTAAMFCIPKTTSESINAAGGIPGPGAILLKSSIFACRCGDGTIGCNEECDDGNNDNGDGCNQVCRNE